ncbi:MAG: TonB-dependent receptor [Pseudomonadota bacterium]
MNSQHAPLRLTVLAATLAAALSAQAQQVKPAAKEKIQKVEVKGSTEAYDARREDTASKIVLNHDEIVKYGDTTVLDVLKRLPGVTVGGAAGRGGEVRMRGLGSGYTQVLINGERAPAGFSMDSLAPESIERIEVMRAATAEFSTQSIAGTINIVLKKAIKTAQREMKAGIGIGDGFFSPTYSLQLSDRKDQLSYSLSVNGFHSSFKRDTPDLETATNAAGNPTLVRYTPSHEDGAFDGINIGPRLNWTFANGDTLTSQSFINIGRFKRKVDSASTASVGLPSPYPFLNWDMTNESRSFRSDLNWVKKLEAGAKLDVKIGASVASGRNDSLRRGYVAQYGSKTLDSLVNSHATDEGYTSTAKYSTPLGKGHALSVGWDFGFNNRNDARLQTETGIVAGVSKPNNSDVEFSADVTRLAAYAQDEWNVTPRWSVYVGMRWEGIKTAVSGSDFTDSTTRTGVWSPLFQTLYKLPDTKGDQIRFAVTRTYKAPNTQNLIPRRFTATSQTSTNTDPHIEGNPNLRPELALGFDASYEHYWTKGAMVSISASMRKIDDYTRSQTKEVSPNEFVSTPINDGTAHTRGIEFEAKFPLKAVLPSAPAIDLRANLSRNWSSVDKVPGPNNRLDQQTPFSATVGMDYKTGKLTTGGSYSFRNGGPVTISDKQSGYTSVRRDLEMYGLWKYDPKNQLRVALGNVLAQDYVVESIYVDGGNTTRRRTTSPGVMNVRATVEMKF